MKNTHYYFLTICLIAVLFHSPVFGQGWNVGPGGNSMRNGLSPQYGPESNTVLWINGLNAVISQQAVSDGIYVSMARIQNLNDVQHGTLIVTQDILTGEVLWRADLPVDFPNTDWRNRVSAIKDGIVYATRAGNNNDSYLYGLDAETGDILWKSEALIDEGSTEGLVFTPDGDVLAGSMFYLTRISSEDGSTVWQTTRLSYDGGSGAIVANNKAYTTINLVNNVGIAAFDIDTGEELYTSDPLSGGLVQQLGIFAGADGTIYLPRCQNNPVTDSLFALEDNGSFLRKKWAIPIGYTPFATHGVGPDGSVYAYNTNLEIMRLDPANGEILNTSESISPASANSPRMAIDAAGRIFVTNGGFDDGMIYSFDADLTLRWAESIYRVNLGGPAIGIGGTMVACGVGTDVRAYEGEGDPEVAFTKVTEGPMVNDGGWNYGMVWADFNNDDFPDLFVTNNDSDNGKNNFLYLNNGDGTFEKVTEGVVVNDGGSSYAASAVDLSGSGSADLFVANHNENNFLYLNYGNGNFYKVTEGPVVNDGGKSVGCGFSDYDLDGFLDLYVVNRDQNNFLYRGNWDLSFEKITNSPVVSDTENSSACAWGDYNNDGYPDLYVANSGSASCLYKNNQDGNFTKVEEEPFISDVSNCSGASWGDADNDGDLDLFVSTGQLGMYENWFYLNNGDGTFTKVTDSPLVNEATWSSGSAWGDYDKDGDLDLAVGGYDGDNLLFNNDGQGNFEKTVDNEFVNDGSYTQGLAWADYDNDGDLDIFTAKNNFFGGNNSLFNNNGNGNSWLKVKLASYLEPGNQQAFDAKIYVYANIYGQAVMQMREANTQSGGGQGGQNDATQFFGLGDATIVDSIKVFSYLFMPVFENNVEVNQTIELILSIENVEEQGVEHEHGILIVPNPVSNQATIKTSIQKQSTCNIMIYDVQGKLITVIHDGELPAGEHEITWDLKTQNGSRVYPGVYFCRYVIGGEAGTEKIIVQ
jgi:outer membrane protein assembly factor BamB